jgi:O-glycosyl hydrolase
MLVSSYINLNKLDKSKDVNEKGGVKIMIGLNDTVDQYGNNASIWVDQTKEQREAGEPKTYLGNGRVVFINPNKTIEVAEYKEFVSNDAQNPQSVAAQAAPVKTETTDLPF